MTLERVRYPPLVRLAYFGNQLQESKLLVGARFPRLWVVDRYKQMELRTIWGDNLRTRDL